jgi:hypothetical protein
LISLIERDGFSKEILELETFRRSAKNVPPITCGFFGFGFAMFIKSDLLLDKIRARTVAERAKWFTPAPAGQIIGESVPTQFKFLVTYYLSAESRIDPKSLELLIANAISPTMSYRNLIPGLDATPDNLSKPIPVTLSTPIKNIANNLLAGVLQNGKRNPKYNVLLNFVIYSVRQARSARLDQDAWSAAFVVSMIRRTAIELKLEITNGTFHEGRDKLLQAGVGHRQYIYEAYQRLHGIYGDRTLGTYHAFSIETRIPQVGDIIVQDRQANTIGNVIQFRNIPTQLAPGKGRELHGDIVVEVPTGSNFVVTIGGNVGHSVTRRRYPMDGNRHLIANAGQLYTQENRTGHLPNIPPPPANAPAPAAPLNDQSTGRIFALLSPVEDCHHFPCHPDCTKA